MTSRVEILVHVSAPSGGADDSRYRKEAQGFLEFRSHPSRRANVIYEDKLLSQAPDGLRSSSRGDDVLVNESFPTQRVENIRHLFQRAVGDATPKRADTAVASPAVPWTSIKETPRLLIERTPALPRPQTAPSVATPSEDRKVLRRTHSDSWETPPSVILDSQPSQESMRVQTASSPVAKRPFQSSSPSPGKEQTPPTKRLRRQSPLLLASERPLGFPSDPASSRELCPLSFSASQTAASPPKPTEDLPLEIHPPKPRIANRKYVTHITKPLRELAAVPETYAIQQRISLSRPVDKMERGHWLISLSAWDAKAKTGFWKFLTDFIGKGKAGWGVWTMREMVDRSTADGSDKENQAPGQEEVAKVFCWGEVLREVYVVLYIAAGKRRKTSMQWIDAEGSVVVDMK